MHEIIHFGKAMLFYDEGFLRNFLLKNAEFWHLFQIFPRGRGRLQFCSFLQEMEIFDRIAYKTENMEKRKISIVINCGAKGFSEKDKTGFDKIAFRRERCLKREELYHGGKNQEEIVL